MSSLSERTIELYNRIPEVTLADGNKITIPKWIREERDIQHGDYIEVTIKHGAKPDHDELGFTSKLISNGRITVPEYDRLCFNLSVRDPVKICDIKKRALEPTVRPGATFSSGTFSLPPPYVSGLCPGDRIVVSINGKVFDVRLSTQMTDMDEPWRPSHNIIIPDDLGFTEGDVLKVDRVEYVPPPDDGVTLAPHENIMVPKPIRATEGLEIGDQIKVKFDMDGTVEFFKDRNGNQVWIFEGPIYYTARDALPLFYGEPQHMPVSDVYRIKSRQRDHPSDLPEVATLTTGNKITVPKSLREGGERGDFVRVSVRPEGRNDLSAERFIGKLQSNNRVTVPKHIRLIFDLAGGERLNVVKYSVLDDPSETDPPKLSDKRVRLRNRRAIKTP